MGIDFLPSDIKTESPGGKKIREIEYTNPDLGKEKVKTTKHGGVLSIFKRRSDPVVATPPPPPVPQARTSEPQVQRHAEKPMVQRKTVITFQPAEKKKPTVAKEKKHWLGGISRLFSRKTKAPIQPASSIGQFPQAPKYDAPSEKPVQKQTAPAQASRPPVQPRPQGQEEDMRIRTTAPQPTPAAPFKPFVAPSATANPQAPQPAANSQNLSPVPPPGVGVNPPQTVPTYTNVEMEQGPSTQGLKFNVNLVPDDLIQRKQSISRVTLLGLVLVLSLAVVGIGYFGLSYYKTQIQSESQNLDKKIADVKQSILRLEPIQRDAAVLEKRSQEIQTILDSQIYWSKLFSKLEEYTHSNVQIIRVSSKGEGVVKITGKTTDTKYAFEQLHIFQSAKDFILSAEFDSLPKIPVQTNTNSSTINNEQLNIPGLDVPIPGQQPPNTNTSAPSSEFTMTLELQPEFLSKSQQLEAL